MPRHTFTYTPDSDNEYDHCAVTVSTDAEDLYKVLEAVEAYLKAAGFGLAGALDIVDENGVSTDLPSAPTE